MLNAGDFVILKPRNFPFGGGRFFLIETTWCILILFSFLFFCSLSQCLERQNVEKNKNSPSACTILFFQNALQGPKGELSLEYPADYISMKVDGEQIQVDRTSSTKKAREQHALYRTLANNMFAGVSTGFEKKLVLQGVGYKAAMQGSKAVSLSLGKAHPDVCEFPEGVTVKVDSPTELTVSGYDKAAVGNFAAIIRSKRVPEPYKGKGIRYADEVILRKEGKRK